MLEFERVAVASRVFSLAAILGLAMAFGNTAAVGITLVVAGAAALASYVSAVTPAPIHWVLAAEAGLASAIVVTALPHSLVLLPYLVALPLLSGLARGLLGATAVVSVQMAIVVSLTAAYGGIAGLGDRAEVLAPWALTIAGAGFLGAWTKKLGRTPGSVTDEHYESARRLLGQLRTLARRLSSGLDPVTISSQMLEATARRAAPDRAVVFARTEGGVLAPLAYLGPDGDWELTPDAPVVRRCWKEAKQVTEQVADDAGTSAVVTAFPLRLSREMVGVLACRTATPPTDSRGTQRDLDDLALPLATALAFEDVRSLVTADERQRLAREIHDGIAQDVASLGYVVDELAATSDDPDLTASLRQLRADLSRVVSDLRLSIFDLRTEVGDGSGLGSAISDYVRKIGARSPMTVHLTLDEAPTRLSRGVEAELFRITQEAITNARKHSHAANLWVDCWVHPPSARICVRDDGRGLSHGRTDSYGLRIMHERAERIAADVSVESARKTGSPTGTCVTISIGADVPTPAEEMGAVS